MNNLETMIISNAWCGKNAFLEKRVKEMQEFDILSEHDKKLYKLASKVATHVLHPFKYVFMRVKYIDSVNPSILKKSSYEIARYI